MARILFQYLGRFQHWLKERMTLKGIRQHFTAACPADGRSIQQWPTQPSMTLKALSRAAAPGGLVDRLKG
jgi:hypothetical protein